MAVKELIVGKKYKLDYEGWVRDFYKNNSLFLYESYKVYSFNGISRHDENILMSNKVLKCLYFNSKKLSPSGTSYAMYFEGMTGKNEELYRFGHNPCWYIKLSILKFMTPANAIEDFEI